MSEIAEWKGSEWEGNENYVKLYKETYLSDFDLKLLVTITYTVINKNVVKKSIDLFQSCMPSLYFTILAGFRTPEMNPDFKI